MFRSRILLPVFLVMTILSPHVRLIADGSIYSLRGQGILYYYHGGRALGMGGASIGVLSSRDLNWMNPASLAAIDRVKLSGQLLFQSLNIQDNNTKFTTNYTNFNGIFGAFSVASGVGLGFGLKPVSKTNFSIESNGTLGGREYSRSVHSFGGLNRFFLSFGFQIKSKIYLGGDLGYIFGKEDEDWRIAYVDPSFAQSFDQYRSKYNGFNTRVGLIVNPFTSLKFGGIYQGKYTLTQKVRTLYLNAQKEVSSRFDVEIPDLYGVGLSFEPNQKIMMAVDYLTQDWSKFEPSEFTELKRLSLGIEYQPTQERFANLMQLSRYRLGFAWEQPHFLDYSGESLSTLLVTAGIGIPFSNGNGAIDLSFEFGRRGNLPDNSFKENIFRFGLYVTGSELWFQR